MLFKTSDKLIEYAELTKVNFPAVKSTIRMVEEKHVVPALGNELYASLNTAYIAATNEDSLTTAQKSLLDKCRSLIGPYVCYYYADKADVKLSDSGIRREETATNKTAYQYQLTNFKQANLAEAESAFENLLQFLEDNKADYPAWITSTAFAQYRSLFIKSGAEFNSLFPSHTPCRNYWAMRAKMMEVEENTILPTLGLALYNALKEIDASSTLSFTDIQKNLLYKVKKAIAYLTVGHAIPYLNTRIDANGITVSGSFSNPSRDQDKRANAPDTALSNLITNSLATGQQFIKNTIDFLNTNYELFPLWPVPVANQILYEEEYCDTVHVAPPNIHRRVTPIDPCLGGGSYGLS